MPLSLHAATIPSKLQILGAGLGWLDKAESCGLDEAELVGAKLIDDMLPFAYQVKSMADHSKGAIEACARVSSGPSSASRTRPRSPRCAPC